MDPDDPEMSLEDHLEELRRRLIVSLAALTAGTAVLWAWSGKLLSFLAEPAGGLIFIAPTEAFMTRLKVAVFGGFLLSLPVFLYEIWAFTSCAMGHKLRRALAVVVPASYVLFMAGTALSVLVVVPVAVRFLTSYGTEAIQAQLSVAAYVGFVSMLAIAFGLVFQLPLVLIVLQRVGIITRKGLASIRRHAYLVGLIMAAFMTPGDVFSQLALAVPIVVLFELSLLGMLVLGDP